MCTLLQIQIVPRSHQERARQRLAMSPPLQATRTPTGRIVACATGRTEQEGRGER